MRLYEFAPSRGHGNDGDKDEGSWDKFFAIVMPEMKKMGFATSKDPLHNRGPNGTLLFKVMKPPLDWRAVMFKLYDEDPTQAYWKIVDGTGGETKLLEHGLADLNTQGAAFMLAKIENVLGIDEEQLNELSFMGSQCTKDCSGHRAGYEWYKRRGYEPASWSRSFNNGAAIAASGR